MIISKKIILSFFIIALFFSSEGVAQKIYFRNYTVSDGLCANTIWDIQQDDQGFMWFGTKYGLSRFNGYEFKSYQFNKNVPGTIGNNFIRKIFKYDKNNVWIGTDEGAFIFNLKTEKFNRFEPLGKLFINDIIKASNGDLWIATKEKGIFLYNVRTKKITQFLYSQGAGNGISSNEVSRLMEDDSGNIWIGTYGKGIDVYDPKSNKFRHYKASQQKGSLSHDIILDLYKDMSGNVWIGTMSGGLNMWDKSSDTFRVFLKSQANSISDNIVRSIYQPKPGVLYLATEKGLNIYDIKNNRFSVYQSKKNDPLSLSDDAVYKIFKDREGGIWLGTYFGGLNYFEDNGSGFEFYYPSGARNSLSGKAVSSFLETDRGDFYIGTEDGGLNYFQVKDKTFRKFPFLSGADSISYHNIHALYEDKKGNIWIGMYTGGLNIYNPATRRIKRYKNEPANINSLSDNSIYSIDEDRQGRIWVSTTSGLNLYNPAEDNFIRIKGKSLEKSCIYQVLQDKDGILWIATYDRGLVSMDRQGNLTQYSYSDKPGSINSNKVICMLDDENGKLWIGTDGSGLNLFDKKTKKFIAYDEQDGINSSVIYGILKDRQGKLWFSTNNGIYELDVRGKRKRSFGKWDNLQSQQYNYKAFYKASDGKLYFGGINGFNSFYPELVTSQILPTKIAFTNFQLFNKDIHIGDKKSPLQKAVNYTEHITLHSNQSVFSIEYAALSFLNPPKTKYAFKMDGFDKDWNHVGSQRKATYTNLPAGDYTFKVRVAGNQGAGETAISSIKITILPPFYRTTYAYILYLLITIISLYLLQREFINRSRKKNEIQLERFKNKSEQNFYKQKIEYFTAMAHEIRTPLSLIIAPLERLLSNKVQNPESREQLQVMEENADRLLTLVNQLLDFRRIESDIFEIHMEEIELVSFVSTIHDQFSGLALRKNLRLNIETSVKKLDIIADPEALTKILSNLLINAFKFTRTYVEIRINNILTSEDGQQMISISIEDDGIGIPKEQLDSIFKKFFKVSSREFQYTNLGGTGIGLALAKSLSEKHGGCLFAESEEGIKTSFTMLIPYVKNDQASTRPLLEVEDEGAAGKQTVLVVEDDPSLLTFLYKSLVYEGYRALKAKDGSEAIPLLDKFQVDLVISDVMMPLMDGFELCRKIKTDINYSHLPVILLTAKTNSAAEIEGLESGADAYIAKPFKWKQVSLIAKNLMELQSNLKQRFAQLPFESPEILPAGIKDKSFLNTLIASIEERISDPQLSVEELGRQVGLSRSSLYKKVKAMTGHVPNEFIRIIRLKAAARLLTNTEYNVSEIGYMVGFNSPSYFSKCFYQQFKLTPSEFSENQKKQRV